MRSNNIGLYLFVLFFLVHMVFPFRNYALASEQSIQEFKAVYSIEMLRVIKSHSFLTNMPDQLRVQFVACGTNAQFGILNAEDNKLLSAYTDKLFSGTSNEYDTGRPPLSFVMSKLAKASVFPKADATSFRITKKDVESISSFCPSYVEEFNKYAN
jgi:hypothetical protein